MKLRLLCSTCWPCRHLPQFHHIISMPWLAHWFTCTSLSMTGRVARNSASLILSISHSHSYADEILVLSLVIPTLFNGWPMACWTIPRAKCPKSALSYYKTTFFNSAQKSHLISADSHWTLAPQQISTVPEFENHRIVEWPGLKKTTMTISFQPHAMCRVADNQTRLPRATSSLALNASRDGASTASLGILFSASQHSGWKISS